jgi:hypothetical protein
MDDVICYGIYVGNFWRRDSATAYGACKWLRADPVAPLGAPLPSRQVKPPVSIPSARGCREGDTVHVNSTLVPQSARARTAPALFISLTMLRRDPLPPPSSPR